MNRPCITEGCVWKAKYAGPHCVLHETRAEYEARVKQLIRSAQKAVSATATAAAVAHDQYDYLSTTSAELDAIVESL